MFKKTISIAMILGLFSVSLLAKSAMCTIESNGVVEFEGYCEFESERGGSFSIADYDPNKPLFGTIMSVSLYVVEKGIGEVRGLTRDGINSRWGEAQRSRHDPACWIGSDFKICAR
jgi:hypothetical protein